MKLTPLKSASREPGTASASPPPGCSLTETAGGICIEASSRHFTAFVLFPFMTVWTAGMSCAFVMPVLEPKFPWPIAIYAGALGVLGGAFFWLITLRTAFGRVRVTVDGDKVTVFDGTGPFGRSHDLMLSEISEIYVPPSLRAHPTHMQAGIILEGRKRVRFGRFLSDRRRRFVAETLEHARRGRAL